jgi:putative membrane protein
VYDLPIVDAILNGTCAILLLLARAQIKKQHIQTHKRLMIAAFTTSMIFLTCYLIYHANVGSIHFNGTGWTRPAYFALLISHTILAAAVPILAIMTLRLGLKARYVQHKKIAVWTFPIWLYVSATGVIISIKCFRPLLLVNAVQRPTTK